jgi:uroporphyrinogen decarboxylase
MTTDESKITILTPRERLLRALRGQRADRVPAWMMRQAGRYLPEYHQVRNRYSFLELCKTPEAAAEVSIQPLEAIGSEAVIIFNDILVPLEHAGARVEFDERGPLIHNPIRAAADLKGLVTRAVTAEEPVARTIRRVREQVGDEIPILGFIGAPWTLITYWIEGRVGKQFAEIGALRFREPEMLDALLEAVTVVAAEYLKIQIQAGADAVQIFDTWGSILGQDEYERFSAQWIRRIVNYVRPLGAPAIVYLNGCAPYLDQMGTLGADAVSIDWRTSLTRARAVLGPGVALQGNLDPLALLAGPLATEEAVRELFERFPAGPGHVFNLGHGILPGTPVESARMAMEAVRRYGAY